MVATITADQTEAETLQRLSQDHTAGKVRAGI